MKYYSILFLSLFTCLWAFGQERAVIDKVVGIVGGETILLSEVEEQYSLLKREQPGNMPEDARCYIFDNLLSQRLLLNQAKLDSVVVQDEEVEAQLNARIDRILSLMNNDISQFEEYYGRTITEVKNQFREDLQNQILVERMQNQIFNSATITPSEVIDFFKRIPKDSLPFFNSEVEVGEIVYFPSVNKEERQKAIERLESIRKRIVEDGEDFAALAKRYSDDASANAGGDLGWAKRGNYVLEFEGAAYNLENGEISEIVETEFGFHLIQLLERRGNSIHVRHILIKPEITEADIVRAAEELDSIRKLIIKDSTTFSKAVKRFSSEKVQSFNNDGRLTNPKTGNTFFETADLDPEIFFVIDTMAVGQISSPILFRTLRGEPAFRIILLQSRTDPHLANLEQDYSKIRQAALEEKRSRIIREWVEEKINATFVNVDQLFGSCEVVQKWLKPNNDQTKP